MVKRLLGLCSGLLAAAWLYLWEFVRAWIWETIHHMLNPYLADVTIDDIAHYGPPSVLFGLSLFLFWKTGRLREPSKASAPSAEDSRRLTVSDARLSISGDIAESIPDLRVAEEPAVLALFDPPESDTLIPLLRDEKITSWARPIKSIGDPPPDRLSGKEWATHELVFAAKGADPKSIDQTYFRWKGRIESTHYDVHLNSTQMRKLWPHLPERISLQEAATRAYEQTRDLAVTEVAEAVEKTERGILRNLMNGIFLRAPVKGRRPPSRTIKLIPEDEKRQLRILDDGTAAPIWDRHQVYVDISVTTDGLAEYVRWARSVSGEI